MSSIAHTNLRRIIMEASLIVASDGAALMPSYLAHLALTPFLHGDQAVDLCATRSCLSHPASEPTHRGSRAPVLNGVGELALGAKTRSGFPGGAVVPLARLYNVRYLSRAASWSLRRMHTDVRSALTGATGNSRVSTWRSS